MTRITVLHFIQFGLLAIAAQAWAPSSALAYVSYNRLGYVSCNACHYNSLGSGTLTGYGRSVGAAMSAWSREISPEDKRVNGGLQARVLGFTEGGGSNPFLMQADSLLQTMIREKISFDATVGANLRRAQSGFAHVPSADDSVVVRRALVTAELSDTDTLQFGRDFAIQGLNIDDHTSFLKIRNRRNILDYPTQVRFIRQTESFQLVPYLALPSYEEADTNREYGAGFRGEYLLNDRNSVGVTTLYGNASQISRTTFGGFFRLSRNHWNGFMGEGLYTRLNVHNGDIGFSQQNIYLRPYIALPEWIETSLIYEYLKVQEPFARSVHQYGPELNVRLHEYVSLIGDGRALKSAEDSATIWSWYGQVFVHVQI